MTGGRSPLAVVALCIWTTAACGTAGGNRPGQAFGVATSVTRGSAYLPVNAASGTTTTLTYRESGGPLTRLLLGLLVPISSVSNVSSTSRTTVDYSCQSGRCYKTTRTTTTTTATVDTAKAARLAAAVDSIGRTKEPIELRLDIPVRFLGGDTSGLMLNMLYHGKIRQLGPFAAVWFSGGLGFGRYTFHDRAVTTLSDGFGVGEMEVDEQTYSYFGFPVRVTAALGQTGLRSHVQADFNLLGFDYGGGNEGDSPNANPFHWGLGYRLGLLQIEADVAFGRSRIDGASATLEVGIGF